MKYRDLVKRLRDMGCEEITGVKVRIASGITPRRAALRCCENLRFRAKTLGRSSEMPVTDPAALAEQLRG